MIAKCSWFCASTIDIPAASQPSIGDQKRNSLYCIMLPFSPKRPPNRCLTNPELGSQRGHRLALGVPG